MRDFAFSPTTTFEDVWNSRSLDALNKPAEVLVMGKRCVYIDSHRVAGGKPYVSEKLPYHTFKTTLGEVLEAFTDEDIMQALVDRKVNRDLMVAWQAWKEEMKIDVT
jgi:hypothetical protein